MYLLIFQRLCLEAFLDFFYFPLWWYTKGLKRAAGWFVEWCRIGNNRLAPGLWFRNLLVPMYGQYDLTGKIISFFMRLIQLVFRLFALGIYCLGCIAILVLWVAFPLLMVTGLIMSLLAKQ